MAFTCAQTAYAAQVATLRPASSPVRPVEDTLKVLGRSVRSPAAGPTASSARCSICPLAALHSRHPCLSGKGATGLAKRSWGTVKQGGLSPRLRHGDDRSPR